MSNKVIHRIIQSPEVKLEVDPGKKLTLTKEDVIDYAGVDLKEVDTETNQVTKDLKDSVVVTEQGVPKETVTLGVGTTVLGFGMLYSGRLIDTSLIVTFRVTEKEPEMPSFVDEAPTSFSRSERSYQENVGDVPQPYIEPDVPQKESNKIVDESFGENFPSVGSLELKPVFDKKEVVDGVHRYYGDLLIGEQGPAQSKVPGVHVNAVNLLTSDEQSNIEDIQKVSLSVHPISVTGAVYQGNLVQDFDLSDEGDIDWEYENQNVLPFTNHNFSQNPEMDVLGLRYEITFLPVFKPEPEPEERPVVGDWSMFLKPEQKPEQSSSTSESHVAPVAISDTPVSNGWASLQNNPVQPAKEASAPVVEQGFADIVPDFSETVPVFSDSQAIPEQKGFSENVPGSVYPAPGSTSAENIYNPVGYSESVHPTVPDQAGYTDFDTHLGQTLIAPAPLLNRDGSVPVGQHEVGFAPQSVTNPVEFPSVDNAGGESNTGNFTQPQMGSQENVKSDSVNDSDLDKALEEINSEKPKKKTFLERFFGTFKKKSKKGGVGKGTIVAGSVIILAFGGLVTGGVLYRNSGVNQAKPVVQKSEKNLNEVNNYIKDGKITSEESVQIQNLLNDNATTLENFKTKNFFADIERKRLIKKTNDATNKATEILNKQSGTTSGSTASTK